jgi:putative ABC transport system substrate-binding protein
LDPRQIEQFKRGLAENGLVEGRDIAVDYLWAEGSMERLRQLAGELAQRNLDAIVTAGPRPVRALLATQTKTPIVFAIHSDPVGDGVIESLARPGGNITGLSMANSNLESKRLEVLKDAFAAPIWETAGAVRDGGLLSYGPSFPAMYRRSAGYVAKILNGANPSDLPIEQPVKFEFVVNLKTSKAFGIEIPPTLLSRADEVIE